MPGKIHSLDDFLPHDYPYLTEELKKRATLELSENEETRIHSLNNLRQMLKGETFNWMDKDIFLLAYLRTKKFDVKRAFNAIKSYYKARSKHKDLFTNFEYNDINRTLSENVVGFLPFKDKEDCSLLSVKYVNWNPPEQSMGHVLRATAAGLFHAVLSPSTQVAGIKIIIDLKGLNLRNMVYVSPTYIQFLAESLENSLSIRIRGFYVVNENALVPKIWFGVKQFLSKKLSDRVHFCGNDFAKLHQHIPPDILPKEYGGNLSLVNNYEWVSKVAQKSDYLMKILCENKENDYQ